MLASAADPSWRIAEGRGLDAAARPPLGTLFLALITSTATTDGYAGSVRPCADGCISQT